MDWILSHLGLVATLAIFFVGWLSQRQKKTPDASPSGPTDRRTRQTPAAPVEDQVRRIQEEIRRKIQERTAGGAGGRATPPTLPAAKPRPIPTRSAPSESPKRVLPTPKSVQPTLSSDPKTTEELRQLEERRRETRKVEQAVVQSANASQAAGTDGSNRWTTELRNPAALRRALVLREVLDPPVSLRR